MSRDISKYDNIIDSRDVIARIVDLQDDLEVACDEHKERLAEERADGIDIDDATPPRDEVIDDTDIDLDCASFVRGKMATFAAAGVSGEAAELVELLDFRDSAEGYTPDWRYGMSLINDGYFKKYAQKYAETENLVSEDWPNTCVDWEQAAEELKMDYTAIEFGDETFWVNA